MMLVSASDDRFGRKEGKYAETQKKMEAIFRNNPDFGIDRFLSMTWEDVKRTEYYEENKTLLDNPDASKNGRAYKVLAISEGLKQLQDGEFLIYSDCSPEIWEMEENFKIPAGYNLNVLKELCSANGGILAAIVIWDNRPIEPGELGIHTHENFTLDLCMREMGLMAFAKSFMPASGMIVFQKNEFTTDFVEEWLYWNSIDKCCALGKAGDPADWSYWEAEQYLKLGCRHDQSIFGLLMCKYGMKLVVPDTDPRGIPNHNPLRYCREDLCYRFVDPRENPSTERRIRKGDKVLNSAGTELTVWEIRRRDGRELLIVGAHPESCYATTVEKVTLI
jgi:hypothetical protein